MKLNIGDQVVMQKEHALWLLDHPVIFEIPGGGLDEKDLNNCYYLCFCTMLDAPVVGTVKNISQFECVGVEFKTPYGRDFQYYQPEHIKVV